jgi:hypothetical protein
MALGFIVSNPWNNLKILTKPEIIEFLSKEHYIMAPTKQSIHFFKYQKMVESYQVLSKKHLKKEQGLVIAAAEYDKLAAQYNSTNDVDKKLYIVKKMNPIREKMVDQRKEWDKLMQIERKNEAYYQKYCRGED